MGRGLVMKSDKNGFTTENENENEKNTVNKRITEKSTHIWSSNSYPKIYFMDIQFMDIRYIGYYISFDHIYV